MSSDLTAGREPIEFAQKYLESVNANLSAVSDGLLVFQLALSAMSEVEIHVEPLGLGISDKPLAGLEPVIAETRETLAFLSLIRTLNEIQIVLLSFVSVTMMYYFLPVGVILRTFSLTRPAGAFMMALALGLYFVLPLTYVFNAVTLERQHALILGDSQALKDFSSTINLSALNFLDPTGISSFVSELIAKSIWTQAVDAYQSVRTLIADLTLQTTFFPLFNAAVVFLVSRSLYRVLRSEERWFSWN